MQNEAEARQLPFSVVGQVPPGHYHTPAPSVSTTGNEHFTINSINGYELFTTNQIISNGTPPEGPLRSSCNEAEANDSHIIGGNKIDTSPGDTRQIAAQQNIASPALPGTQHENDVQHLSPVHDRHLAKNEHFSSPVCDRQATCEVAQSPSSTRHTTVDQADSPMEDALPVNSIPPSLGRTKHTDTSSLGRTEPRIFKSPASELIQKGHLDQKPSPLKADISHNKAELQVLRTSVTSGQNSKYGTYSREAIEKQGRIITSIWPQVTNYTAANFPDFASLYSTIKQAALPNFVGARMAVQSKLNIEQWRLSLKDYHDSGICDFLEYGWPL